MTGEYFNGTPLLVGIMPKQHPEVLQTAATLAARLGTPLVCAYVDEASYLVEWDPARSAHRLSRDPHANDDMLALTTELKEHVQAVVDKLASEGASLDWSFRTLTGDPARALGQVAAELDAPIIIVGTSERGFSHRLSEALNGSVGAWLSHHQSRPVLVVPYRKPAHEDRP
ncbi:universal stress protein [Arthrobacter sp. FW306-06-A]|uniref:universal stress protein n=1 Tax=Arthrobacter sp. FW306-06-A TaxID=2879621 RepID=UPI001F361940|nr:universal stress protein [Arthrobacter sp. FW306-06-A]UKA71126.1 universal stress protein [Arthrobacter sp. FW306-06-A]